jgi:cytochrome bd-type quinol oxidase subunit 2
MPVSVARERMDSAAHLPDRPMSKEWLTLSAKVMGYVVNANFDDDGSPQSTPHYTGLLTDAAVTTARMLNERGTIQDEMFPNLVLSNPELADSLTIYNAASSTKTLGIMLTIAIIGVPIVLA